VIGPIVEEGDVVDVDASSLDEDDDGVVVSDDGPAVTLGPALVDASGEGGLVVVGPIVEGGDVVDVDASSLDEDDDGVVVSDDGPAVTLGPALVDGSGVGDGERVGGGLLL
jgi:hypothetical protein